MAADMFKKNNPMSAAYFVFRCADLLGLEDLLVWTGLVTDVCMLHQ